MRHTLDYPKRPTLISLAQRIIRHTDRRGGHTPTRWCIGKCKMIALQLEIMDYEKATGEIHRSAPIGRPNFLVVGIPVVSR